MEVGVSGQSLRAGFCALDSPSGPGSVPWTVPQGLVLCPQQRLTSTPAPWGVPVPSTCSLLCPPRAPTRPQPGLRMSGQHIQPEEWSEAHVIHSFLPPSLTESPLSSESPHGHADPQPTLHLRSAYQGMKCSQFWLRAWWSVWGRLCLRPRWECGAGSCCPGGLACSLGSW